MIDGVRYVLGILTVVIAPAGLMFWFVIHLGARRWRRFGATRTYVIVLPPLVALIALLFRFRDRLLGADHGANRPLIAIALVLYGASTWIELRCWRQLSIRTLVGIPEVSRAGSSAGKMLSDGVYGVVRHPRYLSAGIGVIGNALLVNYVGVYAMIAVVFPIGLVLLVFEERELVDRYGDAYRRYQREVPRIIPRWPRHRRARARG
jgi:protein-S-isoprenylcysteine O-methyltransferase Ste14